MITGFSGIIGCILGGLLEGMISSANTADLARQISMTQTDLEARKADDRIRQLSVKQRLITLKQMPPLSSAGSCFAMFFKVLIYL